MRASSAAGRLAENDAQDVGLLRETRGAGAVSGVRDLHGRQDAEAGGERDGDRRAGRRGELERGSARINRHSVEQSRRGRGRDRKESMLGFDGAAADVERGTDDRVDVEMVEGDAGADDIGDRIGRADFGF